MAQLRQDDESKLKKVMMATISYPSQAVWAIRHGPHAPRDLFIAMLRRVLCDLPRKRVQALSATTDNSWG
jgi:hypothetical protein